MPQSFRIYVLLLLLVIADLRKRGIEEMASRNYRPGLIARKFSMTRNEVKAILHAKLDRDEREQRLSNLMSDRIAFAYSRKPPSASGRTYFGETASVQERGPDNAPLEVFCRAMDGTLPLIGA